VSKHIKPFTDSFYNVSKFPGQFPVFETYSLERGYLTIFVLLVKISSLNLNFGGGWEILGIVIKAKKKLGAEEKFSIFIETCHVDKSTAQLLRKNGIYIRSQRIRDKGGNRKISLEPDAQSGPV